MELMLGSETLRNEFSKIGLLRAKEFSWENTAKKTLDIYDGVYKSIVEEV